MKHFIVYIVPLILMLSACGGSNAGASSSADSADSDSVASASPAASSSADEVRNRLAEIYDYQFTGKPLAQPKILSDGLTALMERVREIEQAEGEILGWEFDPWTLAQDICDPSLTIHAIDINDDGSATASLTITDNGESGPLIIQLIRENGIWVADDFIIPGNKVSTSLREDYSTIVSTHNHKKI